MNKLKENINWRYIITLVICIAIALFIGGILMILTGFNPIEAYGAMIEGALGSPRFIGNTLERAMMLCLLGLATAIGAKGGLFNVGGEGQLFFGALASTMIGLWCSNLPPVIVVILAFLGAVIVGGFYAWIPAILKVKLGVSEVITTIMLNTVAIKVCTYLVNGPWNSTNPAIAKGTDYLPDALRFTELIRNSNFNTGFIGGAVVTFLIWYVMNMTSTGLQIKVTGENERFAKFAGLPSSRLMIGSMVASGAICGFVGLFLIYGSQGNMTEAVSNEFYFDGMLVAMIMNYNPIGIIIMSFFFAIMNIGSSHMEMMVGVSIQIYDIIFSIIIFLMAAQSGITVWLESKKLQKQARKELKENVGTDNSNL